MSGLPKSELYTTDKKFKRSNKTGEKRTSIIAKKIVKHEKFKTVSNTHVEIIGIINNKQNILFANKNQKTIENDIENVLKTNSKLIFIVNGSSEGMPSGNLQKTDEFGGGSGNLSAAEKTQLIESSVCYAAYFAQKNNIVSLNDYEKVKNEFFDSKKYSDYYTHVTATKTMQDIQSKLYYMDEDIHSTLLSGIAIGNSDILDKSVVYHYSRASSGKNTVMNLVDSLFKASQIPGDINRWSPADIYACKNPDDISKEIEKTITSINGVSDRKSKQQITNAFMIDKFVKKELIGISLKKVKTSAHCTIFNGYLIQQGNKKTIHNIELASIDTNGITTQTTTAYFNATILMGSEFVDKENMILNFRNKSGPDKPLNFAMIAQITPSDSAYLGSISQSEIFSIIGHTPNYKQDVEKLLKETYTLYQHLSVSDKFNTQEQFRDAILKKASLDIFKRWLEVKYCGLFVLDILKNKDKNHAILKELIYSATSQTNNSIVFAKIS